MNQIWVCHTDHCHVEGTEEEMIEHANKTGHVSMNTKEEIPDGSYYDTEGY